MCIIFLLVGAKKVALKDMVIKAISVFFSVHIIVMMIYELFKPTILSFHFKQHFNETSLSKIEEALDLKIHGITKYMIFIVTATFYYSNETRRNPSHDMPILFEDISRLDADESLVKLIKYLLNYGFYKFGIEAILMVMLALLCYKIDVLSVLYIPMFIFFTLKKKQALERLCKFGSNFTLLLIIIQLFCLIFLRLYEFDERLCDTTILFLKGERLKNYLLLIITNLIESPSYLIYDYILLMMLSCQLAVYGTSRHNNLSQDPFKYGGENDSTIPPKKISDAHLYKHHIYSFPDKIETLIDVLKRYVFKIQFWMTISIIFFAGTNQVDMFSLCYILWSFVFLWQGTEFYLKPFRSLWFQWNMLLSFNILVIVSKVIVKVLRWTCGNIIPENYCFVLSILDMCTTDDSKKCRELAKKKVFFYDVLAFFFIIFQRRIFQSYYFYNIKQDTRIINIMASRGAKLTEELRIQEMNRSVNEEKTHLENVRLKMKKIKKMAAFRNQKRNIDNHDLAVRSGDLFMFTDDFETTQVRFVDEISKKSTTMIHNKRRSDEEFFDIEISSEKSKEKIILPKSESPNTENKFVIFFQNLFIKLHARSRNHTYIIKLLSQEKKYLKELLSPPIYEDKNMYVLFAKRNLLETNISIHISYPDMKMKIKRRRCIKVCLKLLWQLPKI